ncbi:Phosphoserine phosphatase RsbU, N-terminal domain [Geodermatophilus africanus]|uniref:Phosphoserine phosphatase RsbU, N-terminal domain n=1 Tax=Geodermatophilus africanus TaxID=1137993 RepID=A0A1H3GR90_9ACTN|nr:phosphatase RsbU N-terminal domain-containing protein [Geodermatophilus africanus]SDY05627.1 Phosphoserine phosphatase RsbU, N-terminal domain [Geodermatophilus africanus]
MTARETLLRDYRAALLRYLSWHEESALHGGYQLGRGALADGRSLLEVVQVHHDVLAEVLRDSPAAEAPLIARSASDFLVEVLASYDMARRGPGS